MLHTVRLLCPCASWLGLGLVMSIFYKAGLPFRKKSTQQEVWRKTLHQEWNGNDMPKAAIMGNAHVQWEPEWPSYVTCIINRHLLSARHCIACTEYMFALLPQLTTVSEVGVIILPLRTEGGWYTGRDTAQGHTANTCDFNHKAIFGSTKANAIFQSRS